MKNLMLLLTSLLLAGAASATVLDFERVETHQDTSIDLNQDFQVAHPCGIGRTHVGGLHKNAFLIGHTSRAQCAKSWDIKVCSWQNRPIDITVGGGKCQNPCPRGTSPGAGSKANRCIATRDTCWRDGLGFDGSNCVEPTEVTCPANHVYQLERNGCVSFKELDKYCNTLNQVYSYKNNACAPCPTSLPHYLSENGQCVNKGAQCKQQDDVYVRGTGCRDYCPNGEADENNVCQPCPANHSYQPIHKKCISFAELATYCNGLDQIYNSATDNCEQCPHHAPVREGNECTTPENFSAYCRDNHNGKVYDERLGVCICPDHIPFRNEGGRCVVECREDSLVYAPSPNKNGGIGVCIEKQKCEQLDEYGVICQIRTPCLKGQFRDKYDECQSCPEGKEWRGGKCRTERQ